MTAADVVLLVGYLLAVPFTLFVPGFLRLWRRRETWVFATARTGALLSVLGWAVKGDVPAAAANGAWPLGLGLAWWREGRKRARQPPHLSAVGQRPQDT